MKKMILGIALFTFTVAAKAQDGFSKGNKILSGGISISSENNKDLETKSSNFAVASGAGYFFTDNLAVGMGVSYGSAKESEAGTTINDIGKLSIGGFGRYYFSPKNKFSMFGHLGINYKSTSYNTITDPDTGITIDTDFKENGVEAFAAPGFNYWISKKMALEAVIGKIGFSSSKGDWDDAQSTNTFNFSLDLTSVSFGMVYKF